MKKISRNLTMLFDYYEMTMANGYFKKGMGDMIAYFDVFYRSNPDNGGYAIVAGLEQVIDYIEKLEFTDEDIELLRSKNCRSGVFAVQKTKKNILLRHTLEGIGFHSQEETDDRIRYIFDPQLTGSDIILIKE